MTEHRSLYHAHSGTVESTSHWSSTTDSLTQHYVDGTVSRDLIYLLPILESTALSSHYASCMQLVHREDGTRSFCNGRTKQHCTCCNTAVCKEHHVRGSMSFQDETGTWQDIPDALLCETCAHLPSYLRYELHAFLQHLNAYRQTIIFPLPHEGQV